MQTGRPTTSSDERCQSVEDFPVIGGPLHGLGRSLGLVRDGSNSIALGIALGGLLWAVLAVLALIEGIAHQVFALSLIGGHVRLLLVIPLFFMCETVVVARMATFLQTITGSQLVAEDSLPALAAEVARIGRWKNAWLAEAICLLAAMLVSALGPQLHLFGVSTAYDPTMRASDMTLAGLWYWAVCMTIFRFLLLRWLWHLGLWCFLLWRVSRLELQLIPTHPDRVGGLGYLEVAQTEFTLLIVALSSLQSASLAEEIVAGRMAFESIYPSIALMLGIDAVLFLAPLSFFSNQLWRARVQGMNEYMVFAAQYVSNFDRKWLRGSSDSREPMLGTADLQSLADLSSSVSIVREMRLFPGSPRMLMFMGVAALAPMLPLLLLKFPLAQLAEKLFMSLLGL